MCFQVENNAPKNETRQDALLGIRNVGQFKPLSKLDSIINKRSRITSNVAINIFKAALEWADENDLGQEEKYALQKFYIRAVGDNNRASKSQAKLTKYFHTVI